MDVDAPPVAVPDAWRAVQAAWKKLGTPAAPLLQAQPELRGQVLRLTLPAGLALPAEAELLPRAPLPQEEEEEARAPKSWRESTWLSLTWLTARLRGCTLFRDLRVPWPSVGPGPWDGPWVVWLAASAGTARHGGGASPRVAGTEAAARAIDPAAVGAAATLPACACVLCPASLCTGAASLWPASLGPVAAA